MQPYFFPYIGYFQLIRAADVFVFYDDVSFIKRGWINRNRILINGEAHYLTIPCKKISQNTLIKNIQHDLDSRLKEKLLKKIALAYRNAPYFKPVYHLFKKVMMAATDSISELAVLSVTETAGYLGMETTFLLSSENFDNRELTGSYRIMDMCKRENASLYVNPTGGKELYRNSDFTREGIRLRFLHPGITPYRQFDHAFVPALSIIDVMMFNSRENVAKMLQDYELG